MPTYSIASGSYDGHVRVYDVRMGNMTVDVLAHPVASVRCSADGSALLVSTLDNHVRMLDRRDGKLLKAFGGPAGKEEPQLRSGLSGAARSGHAYRNTELRVRSVFAQGDAAVLTGSEAGQGNEGGLGAAIFAWDVLSGAPIATVPTGSRVKVVSCVAWNEKGGCWAGGCSDGTFLLFFFFLTSRVVSCSGYDECLYLLWVKELCGFTVKGLSPSSRTNNRSSVLNVGSHEVRHYPLPTLQLCS